LAWSHYISEEAWRKCGRSLRYNRKLKTMSLITAWNLSKSYGAQDVFSGVSGALPPNTRIALVGPNGVGKTTLLRLLAGLDHPDSGQVQRARNLHIGYLPQEASYSRSRQDELQQSLWDMCLGAFDSLRAQEATLVQLEEDMADPERAQEALERYGRLQEAFELAGGYTYPLRIQQVLNGLGFDQEAHHRPLNMLSGGERTRALLAELLLEDPDLLILDEPTNHLDFEAVEWLESWLKDWGGAVLIVSHDRYFLDRTAQQVWELSSRGVEVYRGNYSDYVHQRVERRVFQQKQHIRQQKYIRKEEDFIQRNIAGQNTRQAQGRRKRLQRLLVDDYVSAPEHEKQVHIDFGPVARSGERVLVTEELQVGFREDKAPLFRVPELILISGECVALMGPNGAGKTTFIKTILGEVAPYHGRARLGASLEIGYFAQAHEGLNPEQSVLHELMQAAPEMRISEARNFLGQFLFRGNDVDKLVKELSGGERGRLAMAKLVLAGANFLLLDEPTNHLDIPSQEILQQALDQFRGTVLLVSHDRYLIDALATQIWMISPDEGSLTAHAGGYSDYVEQRRLQATKQMAEKRRERTRKSGGRSEESVRRQKSLPKLEDVENRISTLEGTLEKISQAMQGQELSLARVRELGEQYAQVDAALQKALLLWERVAQRDELA